MDFSILEEEESTIKLTVIAIGEISEIAINDLHEKKQSHVNLYALKGKKDLLSSCMQQNNDYLELLIIDEPRPNQSVNYKLKSICSPVALVVDQRADNLKIAQHICSKLREQRTTMITVILKDSITKPSSDLVVEMNKMVELTDAWLELDVCTDQSKQNSFNKLSSLIELIFYDYQKDAIGGIDYADVLTILAGDNKLNNCKIPSVSHSNYLSTEGGSMYEAINGAISQLRDKPAKNSNVLTHLTLNTESRDYGELETALQAIRDHYTGHCYIAPIHDPNMKNIDIHATVFIANTELFEEREKEIPHFLRKT